MVRSDIVDRFLPVVSSGKKVNENYFDGIFFANKFGYLLGQGMIVRILVNDRILPAEPLEWKDNEVLIAPEEITKQIGGFNVKGFMRPIFVKKKDIVSLFPNKLTPKRSSKSTVILKFQGGRVEGNVIRKNEIISKKFFYEIKMPKKLDNDIFFEGELKLNLFNLEKFILEIVQEYDIIGIHPSSNNKGRVLLSCHRADKTKPMIDCILWEGGKNDAGVV